MDHWGDPWADNHADDQTSATKHNVTTPPPLTNASAPVLLNGFLDEAGWGNEDDGFGAWATSSGIDAAAIVTAADIASSGTIESDGADSGDIKWDAAQTHNVARPTGGSEWPGSAQGIAEDMDNGLSETSDSSATVQLEDAPSADAPGQLRPDDDSSARASTSPSETSHNEATVESPRTSIEEDRTIGRTPVIEHISKEGHLAEEGEIESTSPDCGDEECEDRNTHILDDALSRTDNSSLVEIVRTTSNGLVEKPEKNIAARNNLAEAPRATSTRNARMGRSTIVDITLLEDLFPTQTAMEELDEAADDPIYSTSARKSWYRLTRRQTLREFNSGAGGDNHIRVTWANSYIRSEVNKTVGRWAREDRISGTGPGARASFYWDTSASVDLEPTSKHSRTQSSTPLPRAVAPVRQSLPSFSDTPAAFLWNSQAPSLDPWKHNDPATGATLSATAPHPIAVEKVQKEEGRITASIIEQGTQKGLLMSVPETLDAPNPSLHSITNMPLATLDPLIGLSPLDTDRTLPAERVIESIDDDDDWGEMVSSPNASTPIVTDSTSLPTTRDNTLSTTSTLDSAKASPSQDQSTDSVHASPIVRLKSTISPTSALFGAKSFVPLNVEQVSIGPNLLRPANRIVASCPETSKSRLHSSSTLTKTTSKTLRGEALCVDESNNLSPKQAVPSELVPDDTAGNNEVFELQFCTPQSGSDRPSTLSLPAVASAHLSMDSWADADMSFFETAPTSTTPVLLQPSHTGADPFPVIETSQSSTGVCSRKPFTRSSPRPLTPPPSQPLTGATNSAQRRKTEEDQVIQDILNGLPNLRYMLR
ncbi:hypothetical protein BKA66DRAFT_566919 [Pyrenochaeta sp. MPI-SDFR-AT-0127]|nr:hypothetical protein BKA66DRAFT_566919 [Pyrenochaeta sp. MPI-SDFR-AT-0127]